MCSSPVSYTHLDVYKRQSSVLLLVGIEICVDNFLSGSVSLFWSLLVSVPCLILALLLLAFDRRKRFKEQMKKRLHL